MRGIVDVASDLGLSPDDLFLFGPHMAKLTSGALARLAAKGPTGKIVLVSAINPTKFGEARRPSRWDWRRDSGASEKKRGGACASHRSVRFSE